LAACCHSAFAWFWDSFLQKPGAPFADALPAEKIEAAFAEEEALFAQDDDAVYTPAVALWAFLSQVLFKGEQHSCRAAVARAAAQDSKASS